jgi:mannose-6-phosphate isomerase-like protein (cupin superfamily)
LHVGQIDLLKARYPGVRIGFSTHEDPANTDIVKLAIAKGAQIFEKHVGVATDDCPLNAYSANPEQIRRWLEAARYALKVCGESTVRLPANPSEASGLRSLRRGVFLKRSVAAGDFISNDDVYFAFPPEDGQITANDWSKYAQTRATMAISKDQALSFANATISNARAQALDAAQLVKKLLSDSRITVPGGANLELSHHYGIQRFYEVGLTMITVVNRGYCKKLLISLPGQAHPEQYHKKKEETFHVLYGEVDITLNGDTASYKQGDVVNVEPGVRHAFVSKSGCVMEEISSTHHKNDSFYTDDSINQNTNRKTILTYWMN